MVSELTLTCQTHFWIRIAGTLGSAYTVLLPGYKQYVAIITNIDLLINRRTKIVATVGPASSQTDTLRALMEAGVNVFRLNMSHGDHAGHQVAFERIRALSAEMSSSVGVLVDLCGPKIRTGKFEGGGIQLVSGSEVVISTSAVIGNAGLIASQYEALARDVSEGDRILLADGLFELQVLATDGTDARCRVIHGGYLTDHKGINLPGVDVSAPCMTEKDKLDAAFALALGVEYIALSFVREASDLASLRAMVDASGQPTGVISKIEKPEALANAEAILDASDAIMIARGDLGVELPPEEVPIAQSQLIDLAREQGKPVIVATQMLESMISHSRPTRAEVTDVSHAVTCGADAVMLSAETAAGSFPIEAVQMMDRVAKHSEAHQWSRGAWGMQRRSSSMISNIVASAAAQMSLQLDARAVIVVSQTGISAQTVSSARPAAPIIALSSSQEICNKMALYWGVVPLLTTDAGKLNPNELARQVALELGLATAGQHVLLVRGFSDEQSLNLPSVTVITI